MSITKSLNQLARMFDPHHVATALYEMPQTKPSWQLSRASQPLPCATPEEVGISSRDVADFLSTLSVDQTLNMHNLLLVRNGKKILDLSFRGYDTGIWKYTYSACKSLVSLAIGVLIDRGLLDLQDKLESLLPSSELNAITRIKIKDITIETLLTMSTGSSFTEIGIATEEHWLRGFLSSSFKNGNETLFEYNSMNTYVLSYIACRVSGMTLSALLKESFFDPMGIFDYHFETCPDGIEKGGWGLYIRPEDFAKFGLLLLANGNWNGKQLISEAYLKKATSLQRKAPPSYGAFHYGYQMWVGRDRDTVLFNGMHGQNVLIDRVNDLVIVSNAGNNEMFQQSNFFTYVDRFFFQDRFPSSLPEDPAGCRMLASVVASIKPHMPEVQKNAKPGLFSRVFGRKDIRPSHPYLVHAQSVSGITWYPCTDHANCMGIFPRMLQITQGRFTSGLESVGFSLEGEAFYLDWNEKEQKYRLLLGFHVPTVSRVPFGTQDYLVGADFRFARDEYDQLVLMIRIDILEMPYTRFMKFRFRKNGNLLLSIDERPSGAFLLELADVMTEDLKTKPIIGPALNKLDGDYLEFLVGRVLAPEVEMSREQCIFDEKDSPLMQQTSASTDNR